MEFQHLINQLLVWISFQSDQNNTCGRNSRDVSVGESKSLWDSWVGSCSAPFTASCFTWSATKIQMGWVYLWLLSLPMGVQNWQAQGWIAPGLPRLSQEMDSRWHTIVLEPLRVPYGALPWNFEVFEDALPRSFVQWWSTSLDDCWQTSGHQMLSGVTPAKRVLPLSLRSWPQAFQESWNTSHWQKVEGIERLFAKQLPPKDQWPTWQPSQPSDETACLSVLLAQFAEMAQPSTVLKTTGKVARKKHVVALVFSMVKHCHLCLTSDFQWAEYLNDGFVTRRLMDPWPNICQIILVHHFWWLHSFPLTQEWTPDKLVDHGFSLINRIYGGYIYNIRQLDGVPTSHKPTSCLNLISKWPKYHNTIKSCWNHVKSWKLPWFPSISGSISIHFPLQGPQKRGAARVHRCPRPCAKPSRRCCKTCRCGGRSPPWWPAAWWGVWLRHGPLVWINFITTSLFSRALESWFISGKWYPQMAELFRFVKYYYLPRLIDGWPMKNGGSLHMAMLNNQFR